MARLTDEERKLVEGLRQMRAACFEPNGDAFDALLAIIDRLDSEPSPVGDDRGECPTCSGTGCEYDCGRRRGGCEMNPATAGPDAHRQCRVCHGTGQAAPLLPIPEGGERDG